LYVPERLKRSAIARKALRRYRTFQREKGLHASPGRRIFIDCGANTCAILRSFVNELPGFEFFAFEAQPELRSDAERVIEDLSATKITFLPKAVWTANETLDFYLATQWGPNYRGGSTLLTGQVGNRAAVDYGKPVRVEAIDFSEWLRENFRAEDYVIVKMDIEGAEYDVLEKVVRDGSLCLIDELIVEFHQHMNQTISRERHDSLLQVLKSSPCLVQQWH
jgi:FkbM family methyltransferase